MDFGWAGPPMGGDELNLLAGPLLDIDDKSLQFLVAGSFGFAGAGPSAPEASAGGSKRARSGEEGGAAGDDDGCDEEEGGCAGRPLGKRGKPMTKEALAKSSREKARRERLNDSFDELARLCDPSGKAVKSDRVSIVQDAIRAMQQLRMENNQLRQLNKLLEERVGGYERARAQAMYQQAVFQQHQQAAAAAVPAPAAAPGPAAEALGGAAVGGAALAVPPGMMLVPVPMPGLDPSAQLLAVKQQGLEAAAVQQQQLAAMGAPIALPVTAPSVGWLPPPDISRDQQLRPPAA
eukprot:scaffold4.g4920.t1